MLDASRARSFVGSAFGLSHSVCPRTAASSGRYDARRCDEPWCSAGVTRLHITCADFSVSSCFGFNHPGVPIPGTNGNNACELRPLRPRVLRLCLLPCCMPCTRTSCLLGLGLPGRRNWQKPQPARGKCSWMLRGCSRSRRIRRGTNGRNLSRNTQNVMPSTPPCSREKLFWNSNIVPRLRCKASTHKLSRIFSI